MRSFLSIKHCKCETYVPVNIKLNRVSELCLSSHAFQSLSFMSLVATKPECSVIYRFESLPPLLNRCVFVRD